VDSIYMAGPFLVRYARVCDARGTDCDSGSCVVPRSSSTTSALTAPARLASSIPPTSSVPLPLPVPRALAVHLALLVSCIARPSCRPPCWRGHAQDPASRPAAACLGSGPQRRLGRPRHRPLAAGVVSGHGWYTMALVEMMQDLPPGI